MTHGIIRNTVRIFSDNPDCVRMVTGSIVCSDVVGSF